jgi:methylmalonyl-CoA mutase C-terminal domain/subunit
MALALAFRDAGYEVIYTGCNQNPRQIVSSAIQEDVDMIALGACARAHTFSFKRIMALLREYGAQDISVIGGGAFPRKAISKLKKIGVKELFEYDSKLKDIIGWVSRNIRPRATLA